jgi:hypothetical protein
MRTIRILFFLAILVDVVNAQQNPPTDQDKRSEDVVKRGEHVMGSSHEATTHHFRLFEDGGEITVTAKNRILGNRTRRANSAGHDGFRDHRRGHAFLLFQIVDHRTGDVPTISDSTRK